MKVRAPRKGLQNDRSLRYGVSLVLSYIKEKQGRRSKPGVKTGKGNFGTIGREKEV